ncbi:DNA repair protein RAD5A isoform X3 [Oryza brachyantha]|nr:DNA repair protein RAD5A isoform X3 [Oryza brachyantha]
MGKERGREEQVATVRAVLGEGTPEMEIIRALHMAGGDPTRAINILLDSPPPPSPSPSPPAAKPAKTPTESTPPAKTPAPSKAAEKPRSSVGRVAPATTPAPEPANGGRHGEHWWLVGSVEMAGLSTCKGRRVASGDAVTFSFPNSPVAAAAAAGKSRPGRLPLVSSSSEIMRFSTPRHGEVGRIPNEWARCLLPLLKKGKIKIEGVCNSAPEVLSIMDTVLLTVSVYINSSLFHGQKQSTPKAARAATEDSTFHPLPALFKLTGLSPFKKAAFTPEDLYSRKRPLEMKQSNVPPTKLTTEKLRLSSDGKEDDEGEGIVSDSDLDDIIGISDSSALEEREPPDALQCDLRPYQKQALYWMMQLEKGSSSQDAATTLHPCWEAYKLEDKRGLVLYLNVFSGDATTEFPSTLQLARGGILADAMGLGKTIMTISLLLADSSKGCISAQNSTQICEETNGLSESPIQSQDAVKKLASPFSFSKLRKHKAPLIAGGNLIVCPMTLLGQWKAEIEAHTTPGSVSIYVHYGQNRPKEASLIGQSDIVLTTYGVLSSEFSNESSTENGGVYSIHWFRVVLDEAHMIKSPKSLISLAAAALTADRRWCLTGTPIQNNLEDIYSLFRFLRVEPWRNWALWHKLVQKPYEEGDERGLKLVQSILKPIMLRRNKNSTDKEGRPIIVLPPANIEVKYCDLSEAEKDFYEALFRRSKVKFDQFVEQGRVLHNYASILELLLRLRQCCDHPFLVLSRGDTQEFADLNKLAKRFLNGGSGAVNGDSSVPSRAYIEEVVQELQKGEGECPICLEAFEDAVLTPCAHRLCRECLLSSWRSTTAGLCPV